MEKILEIVDSIQELEIDVPVLYERTACREILEEEIFDPGIGEMIVNPTTNIAYFRVR